MASTKKSEKEEKPSEPVFQEYRLKDKVKRVVRSGFTLTQGETKKLPVKVAQRHEDVLVPVDTKLSKETNDAKEATA